jgi:hypothetical protein
MIYQFETRAGGRITYTDIVGAQILHLIGKQPGPRGVIPVEEIPAALAALEAAVAREKSAGAEERRALDPHASNQSEQDERDREPAITLGQRAYPFIDLLRHAQNVREDVTWGI